jgi:hypothetical protein
MKCFKGRRPLHSHLWLRRPDGCPAGVPRAAPRAQMSLRVFRMNSPPHSSCPVPAAPLYDMRHSHCSIFVPNPAYK